MDLHEVDERLRGEHRGHQVRGPETPDAVSLWTCGMHPNVIEHEEGICPICRMDLVPLEHDDAIDGPGSNVSEWICTAHDVIVESEPGECPICGRKLVGAGDIDPSGSPAGDHDAGPRVTIDGSVIQKMNVRTTTVRRSDLSRPIQTVGHLDYDEDRMVSVTTRFSGFVEKVWVNYVGQPVRRGDPLFAVYAPELVQTQRELIAAVEYAAKFDDASPDVRGRALALVEAARTRLEYWEIPAESIAEIEFTGTIQRTHTVKASADGVVMQRMHGLEGMAIRPGMEVIHIADLTSLWLRVEVFEHQLPWLDIGSLARVSFDYLPGENFSGRVRFIEPEVSPETRTVTLTLEVPNPSGRLRVGMFATVEFDPLVARSALVVPAQAVIRSGDRNIAVVALGDGRFVPREVALGAEAEGLVQVLEGLDEGDEIVVSAQFLIDSESNLRAAISSMLASRDGHLHGSGP
jgi:Cu(I)/Ag(I) efflux system membrane fusion protein/cobalt-zinc-cadmium efflux system membrane fusion protein